MRNIATMGKARPVAIVLCLLLCVASFAAALPNSPHPQKCAMAPAAMQHSGHAMPHATGHDCCPRKVETRSCCPMHLGAMPAQCAPQPECCQIAEERTLPVPRESAVASGKVQNEGRIAPANILNVARSNLQRYWLELGLRYSRPVFEAKADLRI